MEMDFLRSARCSRLEKSRNNVIREKMIIKNFGLDFIRYKQLNWYDHERKKGSFGKFWNGAHLEDEEGKDLEIRGRSKLQQE